VGILARFFDVVGFHPYRILRINEYVSGRAPGLALAGAACEPGTFRGSGSLASVLSG